jgi:hypothetical protein
MASYHINGAGEVGACRARTRPCPFGGVEKHHPTREAARAAYEAQASGGELQGRGAFAASQARGKDGQLLTLYHGSTASFEEFLPEFTGKGNDSYGSGFYFTDSEDVAAGYAEGGETKVVHLNIRRPLVVDGQETGGMSEVTLPSESISSILSHHPDIFRQPTDEEAMNPLGDYAAEYWDKPSWSRQELQAMVKQVAEEYFSFPGNFAHLETFFGQEHSGALRQGITEATGYDGVRVTFEREKTEHWVAWFPEQVRILETRRGPASPT